MCREWRECGESASQGSRYRPWSLYILYKELECVLWVVCVCFELNESVGGYGNQGIRDNRAEAERWRHFAQEIRGKWLALVSSGRRQPPPYNRWGHFCIFNGTEVCKRPISTGLFKCLHACSPCGLARASERASFTETGNGRYTCPRASGAVGALSLFPSRSVCPRRARSRSRT